MSLQNRKKTLTESKGCPKIKKIKEISLNNINFTYLKPGDDI